MKIKEIFRENKIIRYKTIVDNYNNNINYYIECLNDDEKLIELVETPCERVFVQETKNNLAPQEKEVLKKMAAKEKVEVEIRKLKKKRNSFFAQLYIIDSAIEYLKNINKEIASVIELRYIDRLSWKDVELNFNNNIRNNIKTIGYDQLSRMAREGIEILQEYIDSFPANEIDYLATLKNI